MNNSIKEIQYIKVDGKIVDKKIYEDCKSLNLRCPYCKSNKNELEIVNKDQVFINCANCHHNLTYGVRQYRRVEKYEYTVIDKVDDEKKMLDSMGEERWELVTIIPDKSKKYYFKRKLVKYE